MRISIIDSAECSCRTIRLIFRVFVRRIFLASMREATGYGYWVRSCIGNDSSVFVLLSEPESEVLGLVREGACVGARGATGSFRHRRPRRTDVKEREHDNSFGRTT